MDSSTFLHCSSSALTCKVPNVLNGYVYGCSGSSVIFQTFCFFGCHVGFQGMNGINFVQRRCKADGTWTGSAVSCLRKHALANFVINAFETILLSLCLHLWLFFTAVQCPGGFKLEHGLIIPEKCSGNSSLQFGEICQFTCNDGFKLHGPSLKNVHNDGKVEQWTELGLSWWVLYF